MDISKLHELFLKSNGICTDTRKIKPNTIFFALKGTNFNGNQYAQQAISNGASYAIIDEKKHKISEQCILVNNSLNTLQNLASYHRKYLGIPIIALTGSNGKTTTKELIKCVLSAKYNTVATTGNLNNHIGVPLTLLSMNKDTEVGIVEMGANHLKEIDFLSNITHPNYGYITNIGKAHLEGFGSIEGVLKGKTELYKHLKKNNKLIFLNTEDNTLSEAAKGIQTHTFSTTNQSDTTIKLHQVNPMVEVLYNDTLIKSKLIGTYNFTNISVAIAIGNYFKIDTNHIKNAIESYTPSNNRSQIIEKNEHTIILDAYNANPSSMSIAIDNFEQFSHNHKVVFLGDMFELGDVAAEEHQKIVNQIISTSCNAIYLIGAHFFNTKTTDNRIRKYLSFKELEQSDFVLKTKATILIKGSRGMKLERILDHL